MANEELTMLDELPSEEAPKRKRQRRQKTTDHQPAFTGIGGDVPPSDRRDEPPTKRLSRFEADCTGLYATVGVYVMLLSPADGATIIEHSEKRGRELAKVCARHPAAKRTVEAITQGNDVTALIAGELSLTMAILANHPASQQALFGGVKSAFDRLFRRAPVPPTPAPASTEKPPQAPMAGFDPMEPPERRSYDAPLPVFHARRSDDIRVSPSVLSETTYDGFGDTTEQARLAAEIGLASGGA